MRSDRFAIVHFLKVEKYPPLLNLLEYFNLSKLEFKVYSTYYRYEKNIFSSAGINIVRIGSFRKSQSSILRHLNYLFFNIVSTVHLIVYRPSSILCFETLSIFPVWVYKKIRPRTRIFIHFHEYTSIQEIFHSSTYFRFLIFLQKQLLLKTYWISHTNKDRLAMFKRDFKITPLTFLKVLPNYPPEKWYIYKLRDKIIEFPIKFVYIGALSLDTMFTKEFALWIRDLNGLAYWDIFSNNFHNDVLLFLSNLDCPFISFKGDVNYFDLPLVLNKYDIGVILYKGHIPNYVYNAPNKLFEYYACNLDVWFPDVMIGSLPFVTSEAYPKIIALDFQNLRYFDFGKAVNREGLFFHKRLLTSEGVLSELKEKLITNDR